MVFVLGCCLCLALLAAFVLGCGFVLQLLAAFECFLILFSFNHLYLSLQFIQSSFSFQRKRAIITCRVTMGEVTVKREVTCNEFSNRKNNLRHYISLVTSCGHAVPVIFIAFAKVLYINKYQNGIKQFCHRFVKVNESLEAIESSDIIESLEATKLLALEAIESSDVDESLEATESLALDVDESVDKSLGVNESSVAGKSSNIKQQSKLVQISIELNE
ncbi:hypothetical protein ACHAW5_000564 [Stephanodiscus triporus]|uniref:Uncharacterized protein n=1 Tax=Stephanodiscus triporus TaxID=2934178 RepID=A0ABD3NPQ8_9STRA